jgi:hypothetical protein
MAGQTLNRWESPVNDVGFDILASIVERIALDFPLKIQLGKSAES